MNPAAVRAELLAITEAAQAMAIAGSHHRTYVALERLRRVIQAASGADLRHWGSAAREQLGVLVRLMPTAGSA